MYFSKQKGWVSLPIIAVILVVASVSIYFQERLESAYRWRGELQEAQANQGVWTLFEQRVAATVDFKAAQWRDCVGFCTLAKGVTEKTWRHGDETLYYRWERYDSASNELTKSQRFYRLCATQNQQQYRCWWWQAQVRVSSGWVSVSD